MPRRADQTATEVQHEERISVLQRDMTAMNGRFDRHLEIYAQNGKELAAVKVGLGGVQEQLQEVALALKTLNDELGRTYVTNDRFSPVKLITYGIISIVGLGVLSAIVESVIK